MRVRSWPSRPFKLKDAGVVGWCLLAAVLLLPSRQEGAPIDGSTDRSQQATAKLANHKPSQAEQARVMGTYGRLPLSFEANQGQTDSRVRFLSRGGGYSLFLTPNEAVLALQRGETQKPGRKADRLRPPIEGRKLATPDVLHMQLMGSNAAAGMTGLDELPGKSNYLLGSDRANWRTNLPNYRKVAEHGVYPGIDLIYYGTQRQLEYDFVIGPGADPRAIRLAFQGANHLRIDSQGNLIASIRGGEVSFQRPIAYQETPDGAKQPVVARYSIKGRRNVAFEVGKHDPSRSLIIDPTLAYSTYLGGSSIDGANAIAVAPDGTAFIAGETFSTNFPTAGPVQATLKGTEDAFVAKISADGSKLLYSTYLGGSAASIGYGVAVDSLGEAYVAGTTDSPDFPVTPGAFGTLCGADGKCGATWNPQGFTVYNCFISKFNTEGTGLVYSGLLAYYTYSSCRSIAVDGPQDAYVTGDVGPNIPMTIPPAPNLIPPPPFCTYNGFQTFFGGSGGTEYGGVATDAFVVKVDSAGSELLYCTYIGGSNEDVGYAIAVDTSADAYVTGVTYSSDFPLTIGALQAAYSGAGDAFLTVVSTSAKGPASERYSTYLGGNGLFQGNGIAVDLSGNTYLAGLTTSTSLNFTLPSTFTPYQSTCTLDSLNVCEGNAFIAKFSPADALTYFTYLGGSLATSATAIAVDPSGDVYLTGSTSGDLPSAGTPQSTYGGGNADAYVAELYPLNPPATALVYSSYLGGSNSDTGTGIALNPASPSCVVLDGNTICNVYVTGQTCSLDFPLANPLQTTPGGGCDAFISEVTVLEGIAVNPSGLLFPTESIGTTSPAQTVTVTNGGTQQTISSISITGTAATDFSENNTCPIAPSTLAASATCTITVTFTPSAPGIRKAQIEITDTAPGSPQVISLTGSTSNVGLSPTSLSFGNQQVGVPSAAQPITVTNDGTTALTISSVAASGEFIQTNDCTSAPLEPTTNCVVNVTFTPTAPGPALGALTITDNAPGSPQVTMLAGSGVAAPSVSLSTNTISFSPQAVGTSSTPQSVTLTNTGGSPLTITSIAASGDFAQSNDCGASIASGTSCAISITFTPTAVGNRYGAVTITDSAASSPQTISLAGSGLPAPADFAVSVAPTSATVIAGNSVAYTLTVTPIFGFNTKVTLSCSGAPTAATCSVSPASVTPDGTNPVTATVTVKTTVRSMPPPRWGPKLNLPRLVTRVMPTWFLWLLLLLALVASQAMARRRRVLLRLVLVAGLVLLWVACGAGGSGVDVPNGTPAGNYTITLTGTSGNQALSHSVTASLTVQ